MVASFRGDTQNDPTPEGKSHSALWIQVVLEGQLAICLHLFLQDQLLLMGRRDPRTCKGKVRHVQHIIDSTLSFYPCGLL